MTITGFINHLIRAKYDLATTEDYERYIALLDNEYGQSERTVASGCTQRRWNSGRIIIRGEHCPGVSNSLWFMNAVVVDQVDSVVAKLEEREKAGEVTRLDLDHTRTFHILQASQVREIVPSERARAHAARIIAALDAAHNPQLPLSL